GRRSASSPAPATRTAARPARSSATRPYRRGSRCSVTAGRFRAWRRCRCRLFRCGRECRALPGIAARASRSRAPRTQAPGARGSRAAAPATPPTSDLHRPRCLRACSCCSSIQRAQLPQHVEYRVHEGDDDVYRTNSLKQRLRKGENVLGCWSFLGNPQLVEILSLAGFDFLLLDQEHGLGDTTSLATQLLAMSATPAV